jgi:pyruvate,water dikinase
VQQERLRKALHPGPGTPELDRQELARLLGATERGREFLESFYGFLDEFMDNAFGGQRLLERPAEVLASVVELAASLPGGALVEESGSLESSGPAALERRLLDAVGREREQEAREVLSIGRLSWRLRDDDNILLGRVESQLLRALQAGESRLRARGRLQGHPAGEKLAPRVVEALREPSVAPITVPPPAPPAVDSGRAAGESPRQLVGQPAAPGVAVARARKVLSAADLSGFRAGEILVCDAIQPVMTHLVPLARAVIERRGGMLIHGAIIARELGIPCVNGVPEATRWIRDGDLVTVDGFLGIVTVGEPEFDLERGSTPLGDAPGSG